MSRRINYSLLGFIKRVGMAADTSLFVVVEGKTLDPVFVDRLCESSLKIRTARHQVWMIEQITDGETGKEAVLKTFDYCRRHRALSQQTKHGVRALAFFLDRDIGAICGGLRRSTHMIYTEAADVEAEVFTHGNDCDALMNAASLDRATAQRVCTALGNWRARLATQLREWIELSSLAEVTRARIPGVGFGHPSSINRPDGSVDQKRAKTLRAQIRAGSQFDAATTAKRTAAAMKRLEKVHQQDKGWLVVKGKWVPHLLGQMVRAQLSWRPSDLRNFHRVIVTAYLGTIDFSDPWADGYRSKFEVILG